jgi:hypothetical protein
MIIKRPFGAAPPAVHAPAGAACSLPARGGARSGQTPLLGGISQGILHA